MAGRQQDGLDQRLLQGMQSGGTAPPPPPTPPAEAASWLPLSRRRLGDPTSGRLLGDLQAYDEVIDAVARACAGRRAAISAAESEHASVDRLIADITEQLNELSSGYVSDLGSKALGKAHDRASHASTSSWLTYVDRSYGGDLGRSQSGRWIMQRITNARAALGKAQAANLLARPFHMHTAADELVPVLQIRQAAQTVGYELHRNIKGLRVTETQRCAVQSRDAEARVASVAGAARQAVETLPITAHDGWRNPGWPEWSPPEDITPLHIGTVHTPSNSALDEFASRLRASFDLVTDVRTLGGLQLRATAQSRSRAIGVARNIITRLMAAVPPGKMRFTFFDPLGLGEAVSPYLALADYDPKLIDGKVWTSTDDLRARLADLTGHIELVIQRYLRGRYDTIDEYNAAAGEIAEPYRLLTIFDFPTQFDEAAFHQLCRIIENGPRCGVFTLLVTAGDANMPYGVSPSALPGSLPMLDLDTPAVRLIADDRVVATTALTFGADPFEDLGDEVGQQIIDHIVDGVGRRGRGADNVEVRFERTMDLYSEVALSGVRSDIPPTDTAVSADEPSTWWQGDSSLALSAPLGQSGARDVAVLRFDSESCSGGLLVGRPGSGKSTLLHTYVGGLCAMYSPDELELYLIDFKEGVEFKGYAETALPHARCVAIESEREFGLSVLESIVDEMGRRAELIRALGGEQTTFARVREVSGSLPRILLVFDEFHVLFAEDDRIGAAAAAHLETIIRQGRGFGIHLLLGSQSLSGLDALGRHVLQLLPVRVLLPSSETDAAAVLGEGNDGWKLLSRRGEGILNSAGGAVEANVPFQGAIQSEDERLRRLRALRALADASGLTRRPVVFEGYAAARMAAADLDAARDVGTASFAVVPLLVGSPMRLSGPVVATLRRESAANALIVAKPTNSVPLSLLVSSVMSILHGQAATRVHVVDFTAIDEGVEDALAPLVASGAVALSRRRTADRAIAVLADEVAQRVARDDVRGAPIVLVLYGIHRARDLDAAGGAIFDEPDGPDLLGPLKQILVDGPEVGVHTIAWVDSVAGLKRRLPSSLVREFGLRIAGTMSRDDSVDVVDTDLAATCRHHQVVVVDDSTGSVQRATTFDVPDGHLVDQLATVLRGKS